MSPRPGGEGRPGAAGGGAGGTTRPDRKPLAALACYLAIPAVAVGGAALSLLIDPEMARGTADYTGNYRLLERVRSGALAATGAAALALWVASCWMVLRSRGRSARWLPLAAAGPFAFAALSLLADRSPGPEGPYRRFLAGLRWHGRAALEAVLFVSAGILSIGGTALTRWGQLRLESLATGMPVDAIVAAQDASSGMYAFVEMLEALYLFPLAYLLWPVAFDLAARLPWREGR